MSYKSDLDILLKDADCLLIVPPFWDIDMPCLGVHVLQAVAEEKGERVGILYGNILFAKHIGLDNYIQLCMSIDMKMIGERLFARAAHNLPALGRNRERMFDYEHILGGKKYQEYGNICLFPELNRKLSTEALLGLEAQVDEWVHNLGSVLANAGVNLIGASTSYDQNNATIALFKTIKKFSPGITTHIGGANCRGSLAEGLCSLDPDQKSVDYIFQDESENSFVTFVKDFKEGRLPKNRIIRGARQEDLDDLPVHHYDDYFKQLEYYFGDTKELKKSLWLPVESSRGCWWGVSNQCVFCGLTSCDSGYRQKSPERTLAEMKSLLENYPTDQLTTTDIIMPNNYFKHLLPALKKIPEKPKIIYEQKANLTIKQVTALKEAGVVSILAGVESFCSFLLKQMNKGLKGWKNVNLLRYCRSANIEVLWNILWGFPGDKIESYQKMVEIIPLMHHLQPPSAVIHLSLNRYSPYFENPKKYGISNVKALNSYYDIYPDCSEVEQIGYQFTGDYKCESHQHQNVIKILIDAVALWQKNWNASRKPILNINKMGEKYMLVDTRKVTDHSEIQIIDIEQAKAALLKTADIKQKYVQWALKQKIGIVIDNLYVPLATATPEIIEQFEQVK